MARLTETLPAHSQEIKRRPNVPERTYQQLRVDLGEQRVAYAEYQFLLYDTQRHQPNAKFRFSVYRRLAAELKSAKRYLRDAQRALAFTTAARRPWSLPHYLS